MGQGNNGLNTMQDFGGPIHMKKGLKNMNSISDNHHMPMAGSVQAQRKRRQIMHDNLTNSRGNNRI